MHHPIFSGIIFPPLPSPAPILYLSTSPLKSVFDMSQLSGSINVHDGGTMSFLKTNHALRSKIRLLCRLGMRHFFPSLVTIKEQGAKKTSFTAYPSGKL